MDEVDDQTTPARADFFKLFKACYKKGMGRKGPQKAWPQARFATSVGSSPQAVGTWLRCKNLPSKRTLACILKAFFVDPSDPRRAEFENAWKRADQERQGKPEGENGFATIESEDRSPSIRPRLHAPPYRTDGRSGDGRTINNLGRKGIGRPRLFLGRESSMGAITKALSHPTIGKIVALHGLRGVGKTALAAAYAEQHLSEYRVVWWIDAHSSEERKSDLAALGRELSWVTSNEQEDRAFTIVMDRLRSQDNNILLVYDNVQNHFEISKDLPKGGDTNVIITSNDYAWENLAEPIEICVWPADVGASYLLSRTSRSHEETEEAEKLSEILGGLPLALEQSAAYCRVLEVGFTVYKSRFETAVFNFLDDKRHSPPDYHPEHKKEYGEQLTVAATFQLAIEQARSKHPAAEKFVVILAMYKCDQIPILLLHDEIISNEVKLSLWGEHLDEVVATLRSFALINRKHVSDEYNKETSTDCLMIHRLVREVAVHRQNIEEQKTLVAATIIVTSKKMLEAMHNKQWPLLRRLSPVAASLAAYSEEKDFRLVESEMKLVSSLISYHLEVAGSYQTACAFAERLYNRVTKIFGESHPYAIETARTLCVIYRELDQIDWATKLAREVFEKTKSCHGTEHLLSAKMAAMLATLLDTQGAFVEARTLYEYAISSYQAHLAYDHPETMMLVGCYATLLWKVNEWEHAIQLARLSSKALKRKLGAYDPNYIAFSQRIEPIMFGKRANECDRYLEELYVQENNLGPNHPDTIQTIVLIGNSYFDSGHVHKALESLKIALLRSQETHGRDHQTTLNIERRIDQIVNQETASLKASPEILDALLTIARVDYEAFNFDQATIGYKAALMCATAIYGESHEIVEQIEALLNSSAQKE